MAAQNSLSSKSYPGSYSYRYTRSYRYDVHTDLLTIVSQINSKDELNNNFETKNRNEVIIFPHLQSIRNDGTRKIVIPQELLAMKLLAKRNENLPYDYEVVSTDSFSKSISHPQLKQYLLLDNPRKHIIKDNARFFH